MTKGEISLLLEQIQTGDQSAEERLFTLLYGELRRLAAYHLRRERSDHTLQPTALVHEVYVKLFRSTPIPAHNRSHFMALAAQVMRRFLVDHARAKRAQKRADPAASAFLTDVLLYSEARSDELLAVHEALERLRGWAPRQSQIVEMRYFAGMSTEEIADFLNVTSRTVQREWLLARAWLRGELSA